MNLLIAASLGSN